MTISSIYYLKSISRTPVADLGSGTPLKKFLIRDYISIQSFKRIRENFFLKKNRFSGYLLLSTIATCQARLPHATQSLSIYSSIIHNHSHFVIWVKLYTDLAYRLRKFLDSENLPFNWKKSFSLWLWSRENDFFYQGAMKNHSQNQNSRNNLAFRFLCGTMLCRLL